MGADEILGRVLDWARMYRHNVRSNNILRANEVSREEYMKKDGFTLIELVMIIVILGILALVAMPKVTTGSAVRLEAACQKIASDLRYAQEMALAQQVRFGISFDPAAETYFAYRVTIATKSIDPQTRNNFDVSFAALNEFKGVDISSTSFSNKVEFDSAGAPYDGNGAILSSQGVITLQAQAGEYSRTVRIEAKTGKVSVQ